MRSLFFFLSFFLCARCVFEFAIKAQLLYPTYKEYIKAQSFDMGVKIRENRTRKPKQTFFFIKSIDIKESTKYLLCCCVIRDRSKQHILYWPNTVFFSSPTRRKIVVSREREREYIYISSK